MLENQPTCVCNVFAERATDRESGVESCAAQYPANILVVVILCGLCFGLGLCIGCLWCGSRRSERGGRVPLQRIDVGSLNAARLRARAISE